MLAILIFFMTTDLRYFSDFDPYSIHTDRDLSNLDLWESSLKSNYYISLKHIERILF